MNLDTWESQDTLTGLLLQPRPPEAPQDPVLARGGRRVRARTSWAGRPLPAPSWHAAPLPGLSWCIRARDGQACVPAAGTRCVGLKDGVGFTRARQRPIRVLGDILCNPPPCVRSHGFAQGPLVLHPDGPGVRPAAVPPYRCWARRTPGSVLRLQGPESSSCRQLRESRSASCSTALSAASPQPKAPLGCGRFSQVRVGVWPWGRGLWLGPLRCGSTRWGTERPETPCGTRRHLSQMGWGSCPTWLGLWAGVCLVSLPDKWGLTGGGRVGMSLHPAHLLLPPLPWSRLGCILCEPWARTGLDAGGATLPQALWGCEQGWTPEVLVPFSHWRKVCPPLGDSPGGTKAGSCRRSLL